MLITASFFWRFSTDSTFCTEKCWHRQRRDLSLNREFSPWSLSSCTSSVLAVFRVYCKDAFKHSAFKTLLRPHLSSTLSWKFFHHSLQVLLTFLITVILSAKVPLARNHLTIHRKHPALCSKIHVSWPEPVASSLLISSCSLTVTCCKQNKHQHLTPQSPLPN